MLNLGIQGSFFVGSDDSFYFVSLVRTYKPFGCTFVGGGQPIIKIPCLRALAPLKKSIDCRLYRGFRNFHDFRSQRYWGKMSIFPQNNFGRRFPHDSIPQNKPNPTIVLGFFVDTQRPTQWRIKLPGS